MLCLRTAGNRIPRCPRQRGVEFHVVPVLCVVLGSPAGCPGPGPHPPGDPTAGYVKDV